MTIAEKRQIRGAGQEFAAVQPHYEHGILSLPDPYVLENGGSLSDAKLAWQCVGPESAPLIVVLGGISAHRRCVDANGKGLVGSAMRRRRRAGYRALPLAER